MTFPVEESRTTQNFGANSVNHNVALAALYASGDGIVVALMMNANTTFTTPDGWFSEIQRNDTVPSCRIAIFTKVADGSEGGTTVNFITASSCGGTAHLRRISAWFGELDGIESASAGGANPPLLTPSWGALDSLFIVFAGDDTTSWSGNTAPTDYSNILSSFNGSAFDPDGAMASASRQLNAVSDDPGVFGGSAGSANFAITLAIRPAGPKTVTPATAALVDAGLAPTVVVGLTVIPSTLALVLTPTQSTIFPGDRIVLPDILSIAITGYEPLITGIITLAEPATRALGVQPYAPTILVPGSVAPDVASLVLTRYTPVVYVITPLTATLVADI